MNNDTYTFPLCKSHPVKGSTFCIGHHKHFSNFKEGKPAKEVNKVSDTQKEINKQYAKLRKVYLATHRFCEVKLSPDCTKGADGIHHVNGHGKENMLNVKTWKACCNTCNRWVEEHHQEAAKAGMKGSKFQTVE